MLPVSKGSLGTIAPLLLVLSCSLPTGLVFSHVYCWFFESAFLLYQPGERMMATYVHISLKDSKITNYRSMFSACMISPDHVYKGIRSEMSMVWYR